MSTIYTGIPTNSTTGLTATVSGATNASPIVITTSANHLYATGDKVSINGVLGNTAANGNWSIIVLSSTTFSLTGSTGNGAYTSGGTCIDNSLTPQFTIPSDGDAFAAAAFNVAYQALADRTQSLAGAMSLKAVTFTASGSWTVPAGCYFALLYGCGGGGGGGFGGPATTAASTSAGGGPGGGGAAVCTQIVSLVPGTVMTVTIGAGGAGSSSTNANASDGGDTTFVGGTVSATMFGASGACRGSPPSIANQNFNPGGSSTRGLVSPYASPFQYNAYSFNNSIGSTPASMGVHPGQGGGAVGAPNNTSTSSPGAASTAGFVGGAAGATGALNTNWGGGGGGGGGGSLGVGGAGGAGGAGVAAGTGGAGSAGSSAAANTGAGGGGGGAGGQGPTAGGASAAGGNGGSGKLTIIYMSLV